MDKGGTVTTVWMTLGHISRGTESEANLNLPKIKEDICITSSLSKRTPWERRSPHSRLCWKGSVSSELPWFHQGSLRQTLFLDCLWYLILFQHWIWPGRGVSCKLSVPPRLRLWDGAGRSVRHFSVAGCNSMQCHLLIVLPVALKHSVLPWIAVTQWTWGTASQWGGNFILHCCSPCWEWG